MDWRHWCRAVLVAAAIAGTLACGARVVQPPRAMPAPPPPAAPGAPAAQPEPVDLVIQGAVDSELQPLLAALEEKEVIQIAAWTVMGAAVILTLVSMVDYFRHAADVLVGPWTGEEHLAQAIQVAEEEALDACDETID